MNSEIKESATRLLESSNVIKILSKYGKVYIVGSYAFDLMTEPDIDVVLVTNEPKESSEEAVSDIAKLHLFQKIEYGDFKKFPRNNRPESYIFNMRTPWEGKMFEIEVWFLEDAKETIEFAGKMKKISDAERMEILKLKEKRKEDGLDKYKLSSYEIYKKVLKL